MLRRLLVTAAAIVALVAAAAAVVLWVTRPPDPDAFYDPPPIAAGTAPGTLLRSDAFTRGVPEGAEAWRILYVTEGDDGAPRAVSGLVIAPRDAPARPRPVLAWAHGTTGIARGCAISLLPDPLSGIPQLEAVLARGWVVVATDYPGLGTPGVHPYLVGEITGRSVIDSVRAARALGAGPDLDSRYAVWGESQGGHAALFTGQVAAAGYAPGLRLVGVAAGAPATDLAPLLAATQGSPGGKILTAQAVSSWTSLYPELSFDQTVSRLARPAVRAIARRCIYPDFLVVAAQTVLVPDPLLAIDVAADPAWSRRLRENTPNGRIDAPVILAQGQRDQIVSPTVQRAYVERRCRAGESIDFRPLPESGHVDVMEAAGPLFLAWTAERFAEPARAGAVTTGCSTG